MPFRLLRNAAKNLGVDYGKIETLRRLGVWQPVRPARGMRRHIVVEPYVRATRQTNATPDNYCCPRAAGESIQLIEDNRR